MSDLPIDTLAAGRDRSPTLDRTVLEELRQFSDDEQDLVQELVGLFLEDTPAQLLALQQALRSSDLPEVERRSHRLKGSAGSIGAIRLREICEVIERQARSGQLQLPENVIQAIAAEVDTLCEELSHLKGA